MTTAIDIFRFTKPATHTPMIQEEQVYNDLADMIAEDINENCEDYNNTAGQWLENLHGFVIDYTVNFSGYWDSDKETIDGRTYDFGGFRPTGSFDITVDYCYKLYNEGEDNEFEVDFDIDVSKLERMVAQRV